MKKVPHLFSKIIVIWCLLCTTVFSAFALFTLFKTGNDATGILSVIIGFFGSELLFMCMRKILRERKK